MTAVDQPRVFYPLRQGVHVTSRWLSTFEVYYRCRPVILFGAVVNVLTSPFCVEIQIAVRRVERVAKPPGRLMSVMARLLRVFFAQLYWLVLAGRVVV